MNVFHLAIIKAGVNRYVLIQMVVLLQCNMRYLLAKNGFKYLSIYVFGTHYSNVIVVIHLKSLIVDILAY